jgi:hypothetical protein
LALGSEALSQERRCRVLAKLPKGVLTALDILTWLGAMLLTFETVIFALLLAGWVFCSESKEVLPGRVDPREVKLFLGTRLGIISILCLGMWLAFARVLKAQAQEG